ncbi:hypothetical protein GCM10008905_21790 [Clostridium malenominatum]|uniref:Uncharacterized protein n=1 Tax=Clostridium malenominatum TaxID=1539 RepID=A0ABN1J1F8_9CLOT
MSRDEKFIKSWEKERGKGKFKYMLASFIKFILAYWATIIIIIVVQGDDFQRLIKYLPIFFGCLIGFTVMLPLNWNRNEEKYKQLLSDE